MALLSHRIGSTAIELMGPYAGLWQDSGYVVDEGVWHYGSRCFSGFSTLISDRSHLAARITSRPGKGTGYPAPLPQIRM